jgi:tetratricopeptide (TPR) repeat protein
MEDEQAPTDVRVTLERLYLQDGRKRELKEFYRETIEKFPDSALWRFREGRFYLYEIKDYRQAVIKLKKSWEMSQDQGLEDMASLDLYLESLFQSKQYNRLLSYASEYTNTPYAPVVYAQMAQTASKKGSNSTSLGYYKKALEKSGANDQLIMGILDNMSEMLGPQMVAKWCEGRLKEDPDSLPANLKMYNMTDEAGRYDQALNYINNFLKAITPESPLWIEYMTKKANTLAKAYLVSSNKEYLSAAIRVFEVILLQKPDDPGVLNDLAYLLADNDEQLDKAVDYARRACEKRPNDGNMLDTYAFVLYKMGEYQKAEESFQTAIQIIERNSQDVHWSIYRRLGMTKEELGKNDQALESYNNALRVAGNRILPKNKKELDESVLRVLR